MVGFKRLCLFVVCTVVLSFDAKQDDYPTLTWKFDIYDEGNGERIENVVCMREVYYEYLECLPVSLDYKIQLLENGRKKAKGKERKMINPRIKELRRELKEGQMKNKSPIRDTLTINSDKIFTMRKTVKKYKVKLEHPDYKTVEVEDSFDVCAYDVLVKVGLKRK